MPLFVCAAAKWLERAQTSDSDFCGVCVACLLWFSAVAERAKNLYQEQEGVEIVTNALQRGKRAIVAVMAIFLLL